MRIFSQPWTFLSLNVTAICSSCGYFWSIIYIAPSLSLHSITASPNVLFVRDGENNGRGYPRVLCKSATLITFLARFPSSCVDFAQQFSAIVPSARLLRVFPLLVHFTRFLCIFPATFASFFSSPFLPVDDLLFFSPYLCRNAASPFLSQLLSYLRFLMLVILL